MLRMLFGQGDQYRRVRIKGGVAIAIAGMDAAVGCLTIFATQAVDRVEVDGQGDRPDRLEDQVGNPGTQDVCQP